MEDSEEINGLYRAEIAEYEKRQSELDYALAEELSHLNCNILHAAKVLKHSITGGCLDENV